MSLSSPGLAFTEARNFSTSVMGKTINGIWLLVMNIAKPLLRSRPAALANSDALKMLNSSPPVPARIRASSAAPLGRPPRMRSSSVITATSSCPVPSATTNPKAASAGARSHSALLASVPLKVRELVASALELATGSAAGCMVGSAVPKAVDRSMRLIAPPAAFPLKMPPNNERLLPVSSALVDAALPPPAVSSLLLSAWTSSSFLSPSSSFLSPPQVMSSNENNGIRKRGRFSMREYYRKTGNQRREVVSNSPSARWGHVRARRASGGRNAPSFRADALGDVRLGIGNGRNFRS